MKETACNFFKNGTSEINIFKNDLSIKDNSKEALKGTSFFTCPPAPEEKMGMTGCRKTMLRIVAYHGLKARCIAILLHTLMSHTGVEPVLGD